MGHDCCRVQSHGHNPKYKTQTVDVRGGVLRIVMPRSTPIVLLVQLIREDGRERLQLPSLSCQTLYPFKGQTSETHFLQLSLSPSGRIVALTGSECFFSAGKQKPEDFALD